MGYMKIPEQDENMPRRNISQKPAADTRRLILISAVQTVNVVFALWLGNWVVVPAFVFVVHQLFLSFEKRGGLKDLLGIFDEKYTEENVEMNEVLVNEDENDDSATAEPLLKSWTCCFKCGVCYSGFIAVLLLISYFGRIGQNSGRFAPITLKNDDILNRIFDNDTGTINVGTWNCYMIPFRKPFVGKGKLEVVSQQKRGKQIGVFIEESELRDCDVLFLQEVWAPGQNCLTNAIEGFLGMFGWRLLARKGVVQSLQKAGFKWITAAKSAGAWETMYQPWHGLMDAGLIVASKIPFESSDVEFTKYPYRLGEDMLASKGVLSVELRHPSKNRSILVASTHLENIWDEKYVTKYDFAEKREVAAKEEWPPHFQAKSFTEAIQKRIDAIGNDRAVAVIFGGDFNDMRCGFRTDEEDTDIFPSTFTNSAKFLFKKSQFQPDQAQAFVKANPTYMNCPPFDPDEIGKGDDADPHPNEYELEIIDFLFISEEANDNLAALNFKKVKRLSMALSEAEKETASPFSWYEVYKTTVRETLNQEGIEELKTSAGALMNGVRSDHAPLYAEIQIEWD